MTKHLSAAVLLILGLAVACTLRAQSTTATYTQTTHGCIMTHCTDAQFTPTATLSYAATFEHCGDKNVDFTVIWNNTEYQDGKASMNWLGYSYKGQSYYPWGVWELVGTFNGGIGTVVEVVKEYRGCSGGLNIDGHVTVN